MDTKHGTANVGNGPASLMDSKATIANGIAICLSPESDWHDQPGSSYLSIEESSREAKYLFKMGIRKMKEFEFLSSQVVQQHSMVS